MLGERPLLPTKECLIRSTLSTGSLEIEHRMSGCHCFHADYSRRFDLLPPRNGVRFSESPFPIGSERQHTRHDLGEGYPAPSLL